MAKPVQLHPRIRERNDPRVSASALAEFIITPPDRQDDILHDARFMRAPAVVPHSDALRAIRAFCIDPYRSVGILESASEALTLKSRSPTFKPSVKDEAARCVETIELFQNARNAFGIGKLPIFEPPRLEPMTIGGVKISVQPDLLLGEATLSGTGRIGAAMFRPQKGPNPDACKTEKTKLERQIYRREVGSYMLTLLRMALLENGAPEARIDSKFLMLFDIRMREKIEFPSDRLSREKRIRAACGQISRLWASVEPRPGDLE